MNKNLRLGLICLAIFAGMVGAAYASVPLYRLFCQKTGFGGTPQRATQASGVVLARTVRVTFDTNVRDVPWTFKADQTSQQVHVGDTALAYFTVTNTSNVPVTGRAAYNVLPESVGAYFTKLECFCFTNQTLKPGETRSFPVAYYVDAHLDSDREVKDVKDITLSYTFYRVPDAKPAVAAGASGKSGVSSSLSGAKPLGGQG